MAKRKNKPGAGRPGTDWTKERIKELKKLYPTNDNIVVAKKMGITVSAVRNAAIKYKVKKATRYWDRPWEILVVKNWQTHTPEEIMELLLRKFKVAKTKWAIINKYRELSGKR